MITYLGNCNALLVNILIKMLSSTPSCKIYHFEYVTFACAHVRNLSRSRLKLLTLNIRDYYEKVFQSWKKWYHGNILLKYFICRYTCMHGAYAH